MIKKILPIVLILIGLGAGAGAGLYLRPHPDPEADAPPEETAPELLPDYVKLTNQFIVPLLDNGRISSMVIVSLSLEVKQGNSEMIYLREPKLRDAFLQMLFDHSNTGGFRGSFTDSANLVILREGLLEIARQILGDIVSDVLITDIVRQDG